MIIIIDGFAFVVIVSSDIGVSNNSYDIIINIVDGINFIHSC